jgi:hypothetical protein
LKYKKQSYKTSKLGLELKKTTNHYWMTSRYWHKDHHLTKTGNQFGVK